MYGTGKSTLAKKLSKLLRIKCYDLDELKYIRKYDKIRSVESRLKILNKITKRKSWIVEGAWTSYALDAYKRANLIVFFKIPKWILYKRILLRYFKRKMENKTYVNNNLKNTIQIMKKVGKYYKNSEDYLSLETHQRLIDKHAKRVLVLRNNKEVKRFVEEIKNEK